MPDTVNAHIRVSGVVQMVGFRHLTAQLADEYGLTGWVRNTPGGKVEIEVEGDAGLIAAFMKQVRIGPPPARVTALDVQWGEYSGKYTDFRVRF